MRSEIKSVKVHKRSESALTSHVHWHLLDLSAVELLNFSHHSNIVSGDEVDGNTLSAKSTTTTNTVNVVLTVGGKVVVDDQGDLLNVDATGQKVSGDEDSGGTRAELLHDDISLSLLHVSVHGRDGEVAGSELVGEPVDLSSGVAEDDSLGDGDGLVQIREGVQLPLLLLNSNVELLDTLEGEFGLLDQDADRVTHELGGDFEHVLRHCSREEDDLSGLRKELEDVVDLLGETTRQHLIGLVEDEHLDVVGLEHTALNHVLDTTRSANDDLRTILQSLHVLADVGTADTRMALNVHEVTNGDNNFLDLLCKFSGRGKDECLAGLEVRVDLLEGRDGEGGGLASAGLSLRNDIGTFGMSAVVVAKG